MPVAFTTL